MRGTTVLIERIKFGSDVIDVKNLSFGEYVRGIFHFSFGTPACVYRTISKSLKSVPNTTTIFRMVR